jgi:acyl carrier protein
LLDRTGPDLSERVAALVRALLAKRSIERPVGYSDDLGECGLTSLDLVNLMLAVEGEFEVNIPENEMRPANFRSVAQIATLIARLSPQAAPAAG